MKNKNGISVIIPNYNGIRLLPRIIPPLFVALRKIQLPFEIIVSDDCSTDNSVTYLQEHFPAIVIKENILNAGFSSTANRGIFAAKYDLVFLLNSDVILTENYFNYLLAYFEKPDTFGVMGRMIGWDDDVIQEGGKYPAIQGAKIKTSGNYIPADDGQGSLFSIYLSGANALLDREKLWQLGGFDEIFSPFYSEDFELSLRAWRMNWTCYYEHRAVCRHKTSVTIKTKHAKAFINKIYYRNKMYLHAIHLRGINFILWYIQNIFEVLMQICLGKFFFWQAFMLFLKNGRHWRASKQRQKKLCTSATGCLSVKEVMKKISVSLDGKNISRFK